MIVLFHLRGGIGTLIYGKATDGQVLSVTFELTIIAQSLSFVRGMRTHSDPILLRCSGAAGRIIRDLL